MIYSFDMQFSRFYAFTGGERGKFLTTVRNLRVLQAFSLRSELAVIAVLSLRSKLAGLSVSGLHLSLRKPNSITSDTSRSFLLEVRFVLP